MTQDTPQSSRLSVSSDSTRQRIEAELKHDYRFSIGALIAKRYEVVNTLGHGGFAEVYHCQDNNLPREVALKVLKKDGASLHEEAQIAAALEHSNIVHVYDTIELGDGTPVIIYKYIAGQTLEDLLNQASYRRLPLDQTTLQIIQQVGDALVFAHKHNIIHRDIKPSNIIIDNNGQAYLTDFGLANVKRGPEGTSMMTDEMQSRLGGTMPYMAPEQLLEKSARDSSDSQVKKVANTKLL